MRKNIFLLGAAILLLLAACEQKGQYDAQWKLIDSLADVHPKEADSLLRDLAPAMAEAVEVDSMQYALLRLKTDDKLYLNITDRQPLSQRLIEYFEHNNKSLLPTALFYAGRVCADLGDAPQALDYYQKSLSVFEGNGQAKMLNLINSQMGYIYFYQGLYSNALEYYKQATKWAALNNDSIGLIYDNRDLGICFRFMEIPDSSLIYFHKALQLAQMVNNKNMERVVMSQIASIYNDQEQYNKAYEYIRSSLIGPDSINVSSAYSIAAKALYGLGKRDSAIYYCKELLNVGNNYGKRFANKLLAEEAFHRGRGVEGMAYLTKYENIDDIIRKRENVQTVSRIGAMYDYQLHVVEKHKIEKEKIRNEFVFLFFMAALLLVFVFLFMEHLRKRRMAEQRYQRLLLRYERLSISLNENTLMSQNIKDNAIATQKDIVHFGIETIPIYKHLQDLLKEDISKNIALSSGEWLELDAAVNRLFPQFKKTLDSYYHLSDVEYQISLLIKLKFEPSKIGRFVNRSKQTISTTRTRLFLKVFGKKGCASDWDKFIDSLS